MNTPMYDATKKGFENMEKQIDSINETINKKMSEVVRNGKNFTVKELNDLKNSLKEQISKLTESLAGQQEAQMSKLKVMMEKLEPIKSALEVVMNPPSLDTITSWASSAAKLYTAQYTEVIEKVTDITKTTTLIATEIPSLISKVTQLPNSLNKLDSIMQPIKDVPAKLPTNIGK